MHTRTWNILMILLIGPFAWFAWRRKTADARRSAA